MKYEGLVVSRIVSEMMNFFFAMGASCFKSHVARSEEKYEIVIDTDYTGNQTSKIKEMTRLLRMPRAEESEEYFWSLSGEISTGQEIYLVGIMTDHVSVDHDEESRLVHIILVRLLD